MKRAFLLCFLFFTVTSIVYAETAAVSVRLPEKKAWVGQRLSFFIELRALGSFQGSASFDLPQIPGTIIIKTGNPVVSSEEIDNQSWFVQSHEFSLFSQRAGIVEIPTFAVRFASRTGFTGPASDIHAVFPGMKVEIERPPGSEKIKFLVTSDSLEISEKWSPEPGQVEAGAVFKRTITQRASQLSGMALAPPITSTPDSIRVYTEDAVIHDKTERGDLVGERSDTLTYQMTSAGTFTLPELTYVWWNPKTQELVKKTLAEVRFEVSPVPSASPADYRSERLFAWLLVPLLSIFVGIWQRRKLITWLQLIWKRLHPADKVLSKKLLRACRQNNCKAANSAWNSWRNTQPASFQPGPELQKSLLVLYNCIFGPKPEGSWQGVELARAFTRHLKSQTHTVVREKRSLLPKLNS